MGGVPTGSLTRFRQLPRVPTETWQGGLVRLPSWVEEEGGTVYRPWAGVWVSLATGLVNVKVEPERGAHDPGLGLEALLELGTQFALCRPGRLEVADAELGAEILRALGEDELALTIVPTLPAVRDVLDRMAEELRGAPVPPGALSGLGVTVEGLRAFAEAAKRFYEAAPWRHLSDEDLLHVEEPAVVPQLRHLSVLGGAGLSFGLAGFETPEAFEAIAEASEAEAPLKTRTHWSVTYVRLTELPFEDAELWEDHDLPVAGPEAYPVCAGFGPGDKLWRPDALMLADVEALLGALAETTEDEIDRGRWSRVVHTCDGPRTVTLAIPPLLEPVDAPPASGERGRGLTDRRAMERLLVEAERFMARSGFADLEQANEALRRRFSGRLDEIPSTAATPLEKAQDLAFHAFEARGRRRVQLARRALELSPDCADAYVLLAEATSEVHRSLELYAQGVAAGERALGPRAFEEEAGHFWGHVATRPYMRARFGLAQCLAAEGRAEEAIAHYRDLLRLNPGDNQGVRYRLLSALLIAHRDEEAGTLLAQHGDEPSAIWRYGRALCAFRREGDTWEARDLLRDAIRTNRHVPAYLCDDVEWPGPLPSSYAPGSEEEAVLCAEELGAAWQATRGAERWLRTQRPKRKRRER
jgi:tetratricopeptide (TPR) repeat protein